MDDVYYDYFNDWSDVQKEFDMNEPEPDEVLYAQYDIDGYEGSAMVIYRNGDKIYTVNGGHCSCYGLEGQWEPEEYTPEIFVAAYEKGHWFRTIPHHVINQIKDMMEIKYNGA